MVLPTYNERDNLEPIVGAVRRQLDSAAPDHVVLVVDDSSPDGTGELADRLAAARSPRARPAPAAQAGARNRATWPASGPRCRGGAELVFEMDADFSHDPSYLAPMIAAAAGADLVLGSRYVQGGAVRNWGPLRRLISRGGCWYARRVLGVDVRDLTGGFKCFRRAVLEALDLAAVRSQGYAFQVELTYRALQMGFRVTEVASCSPTGGSARARCRAGSCWRRSGWCRCCASRARGCGGRRQSHRPSGPAAGEVMPRCPPDLSQGGFSGTRYPTA